MWFLQAVSGSLDGIIDTVSAKHPLALYLQTLKVGGVSVMLGVPDESMELPTFNIIMRKRCTTVLTPADTSNTHAHLPHFLPVLGRISVCFKTSTVLAVDMHMRVFWSRVFGSVRIHQLIPSNIWHPFMSLQQALTTIIPGHVVTVRAIAC